MNIVTFGGEKLAYCETVAGGAGAVSTRLHSIFNSFFCPLL